MKTMEKVGLKLGGDEEKKNAGNEIEGGYTECGVVVVVGIFHVFRHVE